jgi:pimeloyl-ACP methyl ester carboxylesterase
VATSVRGVWSGVPSVTVGEQRIAYREAGRARPPLLRDQREASVSRAEPLLLLHGAGGSSLHWAPALAALGRRRWSVAPDLPGHGRSPALASAPTPADLLERERELCAAFAERIGLGRFILVGHSLGAALALELALAYPGRVERLVLVAAASRLPVEPALLALCRDRFSELPAHFAANGYSPTSSRAQVATWATSQLQAERESVLADLRACDRFDARARLGAICVPTTVISAADDAITPPAEQLALAAAIPRARLASIPRAGHFVLLERPLAVAQLILGACAEV